MVRERRLTPESITNSKSGAEFLIQSPRNTFKKAKEILEIGLPVFEKFR